LIKLMKKFSALQSIAHECHRPVRIFRNQKTIDLPLQCEVSAVVSEQRDPLRNPVFVHQMLVTRQPIPQHFEESTLTHLRRSVKISRKRTHRLLVNFKEKSVLAAEMLEYRSFGNTQDC